MMLVVEQTFKNDQNIEVEKGHEERERGGEVCKRVRWVLVSIHREY
jgi:hypothetical protein